MNWRLMWDREDGRSDGLDQQITAPDVFMCQMRLSMHKLLFAAVPCVFLLSSGSLRAAQEDLDTLMMRATVKVSDEKSAGTGFILSRPDPHQPRRSQFVLVTAAHAFENIPGNEVM